MKLHLDNGVEVEIKTPSERQTILIAKYFLNYQQTATTNKEAKAIHGYKAKEGANGRHCRYCGTALYGNQRNFCGSKACYKTRWRENARKRAKMIKRYNIKSVPIKFNAEAIQ